MPTGSKKIYSHLSKRSIMRHLIQRHPYFINKVFQQNCQPSRIVNLEELPTKYSSRIVKIHHSFLRELESKVIRQAIEFAVCSEADLIRLIVQCTIAMYIQCTIVNAFSTTSSRLEIVFGPNLLHSFMSLHDDM